MVAAAKGLRKSIPSVKLGTCVMRFNVPRVMGIVNVTPDSFSGDGIADDLKKAIELGNLMFESGADMVDVGGESTRPGADKVPAEVEIARTEKVVRALAESHPGRVSIDTMKPEVAERALYAGASIINDVSGLRDQRMIDVVSEHDAAVIIMHMKGTPRTMQVRPRYRDVVREVMLFLEDRIEAAEEAGVSPRRIMVDPGIGFGKTLEHNLQLLANLRELKSLGKPLVVGTSRKSFIGKITGQPVDERVEASVATAVLAVREGADMVRVHDVEKTVKALMVAREMISRIPDSH